MKTILIALALAALPALAQAADAPKTLLGQWEMGGVSEGAEFCRLRLTDEQTIGGWTVQPAKDCARKFPFTKDIGAWSSDGAKVISFTDPLRKRLIRFERTEDGDYVGHSATAGDLVLGRPVSGPAPTAQDRMSGAWSITGMGGEPRCAFTSKANATATTGVLSVKAGCAAKWANRGWSTWKLAGDKLTFFDAKGARLQTFTRGDVVTFEGEDAKGDPIYFSRD